MAWGDFTNPDAWKSAMANLLRRGGEVTDYIQQSPSKAGQTIIDAGQRQQALMNEAFDPTGKTLIRNPQAANQAAMNLLEGPLGFMPAGITAWHGSPHTFEKFDMSKVGTGEGAQAYGHGMYFAQNPKVAEEYQKIVQGPESAAQHYLQMYKTPESAISVLEGSLKPNLTPEAKKFTQDAIDVLKSGKELKGNLYKVDIPDEHIPMMLDWDKPLSKQSKEVIKKLKGLNDPYITEAITTQPKLSKDGEYWTYMGNTYGSKSEALDDAMAHRIVTGYTNLGKTPKEVSETLNAAGIKGIRYKDQASRDVAEKWVVEWPNFGSYDFPSLKDAQDFIKQNPKEKLNLIEPKPTTSNFVVFDPTDVKILERNNQPLTRKEILEEKVNKLK